MTNKQLKPVRKQSILNELLSREEWARIRKPVISAFLILHCTLNYCYLFNNHPYINNVNHFFFGYYAFMGLEQAWNVFAPEPRRGNPHLTAIVTYQDGTSKLWTYPRMERLDFFTKIPKERYRKFFDDNAAWSFPMVWPDIARYVARIHYAEKDNPPILVTLTRFSSDILPMEAGLGKPNLPQSDTKVLGVYEITAKDLAGVKPK
ncbi:MAG: hypothetical protein WCT03_17450 [Candidatus Obscuribacterales bacterium]